MELPDGDGTLTQTLVLELDVTTLMEVEEGEAWIGSLTLEPVLSEADGPLRIVDARMGQAREPMLAVWTPTPAPLSAAKPARAQVSQDANLRAGPGIQYDVVRVVLSGESVAVIAQDVTGDWLLLENGEWIAAWLIDGHGLTLPTVHRVN